MSRGLLPRTGALVALAALLVGLGAASTSARPHRARQTGAAQCPGSRYPAQRDPTNPLALPTPPGPDPLTGAHFFVDGPRHGSAAGAIASLLGVDPTRYPDDYSWARFRHDLDAGGLHQKLVADPGLRYKVNLLEKIADEPEAQRFSAFSMGGGPGAIYAQVQKVLCHNLTADPNSVPIISTYFAHPGIGGCADAAGIAAATPTFERRINEMVAATGRQPVVYLLEIDAFGSSGCMAHNGSLRRYEALIRYEIDKVASLPHAVVYVEAGYSDANSARYTARALNAAGISRIRGFFTNDTHENWTISEVRWAERVSRLTHGAHFIVNTAQNGNGPKRNPHPVDPGQRRPVQPARSRTRTAIDDGDRLPERRRVHLDARAGEQQRLAAGVGRRRARSGRRARSTWRLMPTRVSGPGFASDPY